VNEIVAPEPLPPTNSIPKYEPGSYPSPTVVVDPTKSITVISTVANSPEPPNNSISV